MSAAWTGWLVYRDLLPFSIGCEGWPQYKRETTLSLNKSFPQWPFGRERTWRCDGKIVVVIVRETRELRVYQLASDEDGEMSIIVQAGLPKIQKFEIQKREKENENEFPRATWTKQVDETNWLGRKRGFGAFAYIGKRTGEGNREILGRTVSGFVL